MRLWEMLTRNPGRILTAAGIKIQQKILHREKTKRFRLNKPALCFAVLFWTLPSSPSEQHK